MANDTESRHKKTVARLVAAAPARPDGERLEAIVAGVLRRVGEAPARPATAWQHWRAWGAGLAATATLAVLFLLPASEQASRTDRLGPDEMSVLLEHVQGFEDMDAIRDLAFVIDKEKG